MVGESSCTLIQYISIYFYRHWYVLLFFLSWLYCNHYLILAHLEESS